MLAFTAFAAGASCGSADARTGLSGAVLSLCRCQSTAPEPIRGTVRVLVDDGFPPFHYRDDNNRLAGLNVELANAVCSELRMRCEIKVLPFADLLPALARNEADVIISALRLTPQALTEGKPTRPFYRALGHFATTGESPLTSADPRNSTAQYRRDGRHGA